LQAGVIKQLTKAISTKSRVIGRASFIRETKLAMQPNKLSTPFTSDAPMAQAIHVPVQAILAPAQPMFIGQAEFCSMPQPQHSAEGDIHFKRNFPMVLHRVLTVQQLHHELSAIEAAFQEHFGPVRAYMRPLKIGGMLFLVGMLLTALGAFSGDMNGPGPTLHLGFIVCFLAVVGVLVYSCCMRGTMERGVMEAEQAVSHFVSSRHRQYPGTNWMLRSNSWTSEEYDSDGDSHTRHHTVYSIVIEVQLGQPQQLVTNPTVVGLATSDMRPLARPKKSVTFAAGSMGIEVAMYNPHKMLQVTKVTAKSQAAQPQLRAQQGVQVGDIVTAVNQQPLAPGTTQQDFVQLVSSKPRPVVLHFN
jgi:hypothetical protein